MTLTFLESIEAGKGISSAAFAEFDLGAPPTKSATVVYGRLFARS
jgi:hypothetical protein